MGIVKYEIAQVPNHSAYRVQRSQTISNRESSIERKLPGGVDNSIQIAFTFFVIAIAAKLARVDSDAFAQTTAAEIDSFKEIFSIPESEVDKVTASYKEAVYDQVPATHYARQLVNLFPSNRMLLEELADDLVVFADADSPMTSTKIVFLRNVVLAMNFNERFFRLALRKHILATNNDPFILLAVPRDVSYVDLKKQYRNHAKDWHPDKFSGENVAPELVEIAREQFEIYTRAYDAIKLDRGFGK